MRWCERFAAACVVCAAPLAAQDDDVFASECAGSTECLITAQRAVLLAPAAGLAFAGGSPLVGGASTLGMRLGSLPRMALQFRATGATLEVPAGGVSLAPRADRRNVAALALDGAVGLFTGFSPAPTIGGVGSVDLLASIGLAPLGGGFDEAGFAWGAGARVGLLRESFTVPGVSLSAMGLALPASVEGPSPTSQAGADVTAISLRVTVGKQLFSVGLGAGLGWDRSTSDVQFAGRLVEDYTQSLGSGFASVSFTLLVLSAALEAGWQQGPGLLPGVTASAAAELDGEGGTFFGSLALRLTI